MTSRWSGRQSRAQRPKTQPRAQTQLGIPRPRYLRQSTIS